MHGQKALGAVHTHLNWCTCPCTPDQVHSAESLSSQTTVFMEAEDSFLQSMVEVFEVGSIE